MSVPQWKLDRERKEREEAEKEAAEQRAKQAAFAELEKRNEKTKQEIAQRDAEDDKKINALLEQRKIDGVQEDNKEALEKTKAALAANDIPCTACGQTVYNAGPFVRLGEEKKPYHKSCLTCGRCKNKNPGIQVNDGILTCFDCRQKLINN